MNLWQRFRAAAAKVAATKPTAGVATKPPAPHLTSSSPSPSAPSAASQPATVAAVERPDPTPLAPLAAIATEIDQTQVQPLAARLHEPQELPTTRDANVNLTCPNTHTDTESATMFARTSTLAAPAAALRASRTFATTVPRAAGQEYTIPLKSTFDLHLIDPEQGPKSSVTISQSALMQMYKDMVLMRRMETAADALYKQKMIRGFCHLNIGQEAVSVGIEHALTKDDAIITAYRCHGFAMMRGGSVMSILAELMGRKDGITKGKGGSMHMFSHNFYGGNGIVGAQVPVGAGIAFAQQYLAHKNCTISLYGDGAANQGQIFEAYNMAKLWNLPVIFACENNRYGMGTAAHRAAASTNYFTRGDFVPGVRINGMDVLAVYEATRWGKEYTVEKNAGPLVYEFATYRYGGHSMSDPGTTYRTREEIQHMRSTRDPIMGLKNVVLEVEAATEAELKAIDKEAKEAVDKAVEEAKASPEPAMEELWTEIYVKGSEVPSLRGLTADEVHRF
ncbi:dehydrogenase E1 component-domain-containing protein [Catenaria anguillulae PL171]|uniref:Pyruvate dehydrogenase E1 component subunit alpha n=1 Tax=Catenaria anguillulae PL171 TaxID=765915 RepID=A0A1Y2HWP4_9FUNG|nr:dehydrogenase E1 component-domain-containing protein [Catenaria anguillulae PL171]